MIEHFKIEVLAYNPENPKPRSELGMLVGQYLESDSLNDFAPNTKVVYERALRNILKKAHSLRVTEVLCLPQVLSDFKEGSSRNQMIQVTNSFLRWASSQGYSPDIAEEIETQSKLLKINYEEKEKEWKVLTTEELLTLFKSASKKPRNRLYILLTLATKLAQDELLNLTSSDLQNYISNGYTVKDDHYKIDHNISNLIQGHLNLIHPNDLVFKNRYGNPITRQWMDVELKNLGEKTGLGTINFKTLRASGNYHFFRNRA